VTNKGAGMAVAGIPLARSGQGDCAAALTATFLLTGMGVVATPMSAQLGNHEGDRADRCASRCCARESGVPIWWLPRVAGPGDHGAGAMHAPFFAVRGVVGQLSSTFCSRSAERVLELGAHLDASPK